MNNEFDRDTILKYAKKSLKVLSTTFVLDHMAKIKVVDVDLDNQTVTMETKLSEEFNNPVGTIHGGAIGWLVDLTMAVAISTYGGVAHGATVDMNINYLCPLFAGKKITIVAKNIKIGGYLRRASVELYSNGVHCISATGNYSGIKMPHTFQVDLK